MKIHVVSFQVPYPADYGGAIDVFYRLKALHDEGHDVVLHTFVYGDRKPQPILGEYCSSVIYYTRQTGWRKQLSLMPYIVRSRDNRQLLDDLCQDDAPILFEGLHTCFYLTHPRLAGRKKIVRMHNVEHEYYRQLARQSGFSWRTVYYMLESIRLRRFEKKLKYASLVCAITKADKQALERIITKAAITSEDFPIQEVMHLPVFFNLPDAEAWETKPFVLYQGNLAVSENRHTAEFIITRIAPRCPSVLFVIAGRDAAFKDVPKNVTIISNPTDERLDLLLRTAHIHLMITFQSTGIKLKLLNAIARGNGHIIANHDMLYGHSLGRFCTRADEPQEMADHINQLINQPLPSDALEKRRLYLQKMKKAGISRLSLFE